MKIRLRRDVYDAIIRERGATMVQDQVRLTGVPQKTLYRIRSGASPSFANAMRISRALGMPIAALFESVEADQ